MSIRILVSRLQAVSLRKTEEAVVAWFSQHAEGPGRCGCGFADVLITAKMRILMSINAEEVGISVSLYVPVINANVLQG